LWKFARPPAQARSAQRLSMPSPPYRLPISPQGLLHWHTLCLSTLAKPWARRRCCVRAKSRISSRATFPARRTVFCGPGPLRCALCSLGFFLARKSCGGGDLIFFSSSAHSCLVLSRSLVSWGFPCLVEQRRKVVREPDRASARSSGLRGSSIPEAVFIAIGKRSVRQLAFF